MKVSATVVAAASAVALVPPCWGFLPSQSAHIVRSHAGSGTNADASSSTPSPLFVATSVLVDDPTFIKPDTLIKCACDLCWGRTTPRTLPFSTYVLQHPVILRRAESQVQTRREREQTRGGSCLRRTQHIGTRWKDSRSYFVKPATI